MTHLDEGQLHAYLDGQRQDAGRHLAECGQCRARLEDARRVRDRARAILADAGPRSLTPPPFDAIVERASRRQATRRGMRPLAPLAWAATVALAVTLGWYARGWVSGGQRETVATAEGPVRAGPIQAAPPAATRIAQAEPQRAVTAQRPSENVADTTPIVSAPAAPAAAAAAPTADVALAEAKGAAQAPAEAPSSPAPTAAAALNRSAPAERILLRGATSIGLRGSIAGRVLEATTRQPLPGVAVAVEGTQQRVLTGSDGTFRLADIPAGPQRLQVTGVGYAARVQDVPVRADGADTVVITMQPASVALDEVVVSGISGTWLTVSPGEAQRRLGGPLAIIPGLPSLGTAVSGSGASTVARTVQVLGPGLTVELEQQRASGTEKRAAEPEAPSPAAGAAHDAPGSSMTVRWGNFSVSGRALVPQDSLRKLLQRLTGAGPLR